MTNEEKKWKESLPPNYETNKDKLYPYSEMPFQREYNLVKIPICVKNLIEHVSYFGCGRITVNNKTVGFTDCYNVNYEYALVIDGQDKDRKIPNRIPVIKEESKFGYSTRNYLKSNSVFTVTVELIWYVNQMTKEFAQDIARLVNSERGKVIIYGGTDRAIDLISDELKLKQLIYCPIYLLPDKLRLTYASKYRAYLGINELKRDLYRNIHKADFKAAVILTKCLNNSYCDGALDEVVNKLFENNVRNVITYAYKVWYSDDKEVVRKHFPSLFQHIFDGDCMAIINNENGQVLVLDQKTKNTRGDCPNKPANKFSWKIIPILDENNVLFKLYNVATDEYLQQVSAAKESKELRDKFYFEPLLLMNGQVAFKIFYFDDDTPLELPVDADSAESKAVAGQNSVGSAQPGRSTWVLTPADQVKERSVKKDDPTLRDEEEFSTIYDYD